jgi:hypothetical protein
MEQVFLPQMLLIAGTGRNTGKTTLACGVINKFSKSHSIVAIKISPHIHNIIKGSKIILDEEKIYIEEELDCSSRKDSSLMLAAGALKSYFIMTLDENLGKAFKKLLPLIPENSCLVCESGGLRKWVVPGLFLILNNSIVPADKKGIEQLKPLADLWVNINDTDLDQIIDKIEINNNYWNFKTV